MPTLAHRLTQLALALAGALIFAAVAGPAFAHYTYRGCDADGCWRYQCDSRGDCQRTPLYPPGHRWDRSDDRGHWDRDGRWDRDDYWDRRDRRDRRRWRCDRWDRWDRWDEDCRW